MSTESSGRPAPPGPEPGVPPPAAQAGARRLDLGTERIMARVVSTKERLDASKVGHVQRRFARADLGNQAMILASLALSLLLPVLVTLAALVPLGAADSLPGVAGARLGLTPTAVADLQSLFPTRAAVRGASTLFGIAFTVVSAYAWPTALQRGYELAWGVTSQGWRGWWRPALWLTGFIAAGVLLLALPRSGLADPWRTLVLIVLWTPVIFLWSWWTQHFLLRGAVGWRPLLTGAIAMTVGLVGLRVFAAFWLSRAIVYNYSVYGPLGLVFVVLNWLVAISIVMLGGPVLGAALHERRVQEQEAANARAASAEQVAGLRRAAERLIPAPRHRTGTPPTDDAQEE